MASRNRDLRANMNDALTSNPALHEHAGVSSPKRVRTPGKHIVLFLLAVTFMLTMSSSLISTGRFDNPAPPMAATEFALAPMEFLVDLSEDDNGRVAYLKMSAVIYAADEKSRKVLEARAPQIRERVTFFLRALTPEDFQHDEGMSRVKAELLRRISLASDSAAIASVAIDDLVIQ